MPDQTSEALSVPHFCNNLHGRQIGVSVPGVVSLERAPRNPGLEAAPLTTIARLSLDFHDVRERQWVVSPFAGAVVRSVMRAASDGDARACAASQDDRENDAMARPGAVNGLRGSEAVSIIFDSDLASERRSQIALDRTTEQPS